MKSSAITCPKCFTKYPSGERLLSCQNPDCEQHGKQLRENQANIREDGLAHCATCEREISKSFCPHCGFEYSGKHSIAEMLGVSMVGAERAGKSHFLTVLLNSVKNEMAAAYDCSLYPLGGDNTIEQYNRQYFQPLFEQGRLLSSTAQEDVEPLIYSLVFPENSPNGKTTNITFYDACGANFYSESEMEQSNRSIYNSKAILFLIDPTQFSIIRDRRRAGGKPVCEVDPGTLLSRTIHLIRAGSGKNNIRQKISIPIAICLTKMDIVRPWLDPSSFISNPSRHLRYTGFDSIDFESCNMEIMSLIHKWGGKELINQVSSQFTTYGYFAFSSLGQEPTDDGRVQHIRPHRVMDPFLWLLYQNRIISMSKKQ